MSDREIKMASKKKTAKSRPKKAKGKKSGSKTG